MAGKGDFWPSDGTKRSVKIAFLGVDELYQQMLPTKVYHKTNTGLEIRQNVMCLGCAAKFQKPKHVFWQDVVNWQPTTQHLKFPLTKFWKTWTLWQRFHRGTRWDSRNHFTRTKGALGRTNICKEHRGQEQQDRCKDYQQGVEERISIGDELQMDNQQGRQLNTQHCGLRWRSNTLDTM